MAREDRRRGRVDRLAVADVAESRARRPARRPRLASRSAPPRDEHALPAALRQQPRECGADAARRAGDDRDSQVSRRGRAAGPRPRAPRRPRRWPSACAGPSSRRPFARSRGRSPGRFLTRATWRFPSKKPIEGIVAVTRRRRRASAVRGRHAPFVGRDPRHDRAGDDREASAGGTRVFGIASSPRVDVLRLLEVTGHDADELGAGAERWRLLRDREDRDARLVVVAHGADDRSAVAEQERQRIDAGRRIRRPARRSSAAPRPDAS